MNLQSRLAKLEAKIGMGNAVSRIIAVKGGASSSDGTVDAFLASQGVFVTPADQVVYIRTRFEEADGSEAPPKPLKLLNVTACRKRA